MHHSERRVPKDLSCSRQPEFLALIPEKPGIVMLFKKPDMLRYRRLRDIQLL